MENEYVLSMEGISKQFPGVRALSNVKLNARRGKVHALMGENGRDRKDFEIIISPYENRISEAGLRAYHELGVTEFVPFVRLPADDAEIPAVLEKVALEWVEPASKLS